MLIGIIAVAGAATLLGIMPSMQKTLLVNGLPMNSLMFFTNLTISLVCLIMARLKGRSLKASRIQLIQALIMGASGMMFTALLLNTSYLYLPVGTAIMLNFLYPTVVCIVMGTVFREGFTKLQVAAIVVSITGMAFLTGAGGKMPLIGIVTAIASSLTYGGYLVANEKGPANQLPTVLCIPSRNRDIRSAVGSHRNPPGPGRGLKRLGPPDWRIRTFHGKRILPHDVWGQQAWRVHGCICLHAGTHCQRGVRNHLV